MSLADLKKRKEEIKKREEEKNRPKAQWLTAVLGKNEKEGGVGDTVELVFRQELDEAAAGYNAERGKGRVVVEHYGPGEKGFLKRASCTLESEGQCYADERHAQKWDEGWRPRTNFYINVAAKVKGEWEPYVLTRNFNAAFVDQLMMEAEDEGTIMDKVFRVTKTGSKTTTAWTPKRLKEDAPDVSELEFFDIDEVVLRQFSYDEQPKWYLGDSAVVHTEEGATAGTGSTSSSEDEW